MKNHPSITKRTLTKDRDSVPNWVAWNAGHDEPIAEQHARNYQFYCNLHDHGWNITEEGQDLGCPRCLALDSDTKQVYCAMCGCKFTVPVDSDEDTCDGCQFHGRDYLVELHPPLRTVPRV